MEYPKTIALEASNRCNAKCIFCPIFSSDRSIDRKSRPAVSMKFSFFVSLVDQIATWKEKPRSIYLNGVGEPLLDKNFLKKIKYLHMKGLAERVCLLTNAQLLTGQIAAAICEASIGVIRPALDSHLPEVYKNIRKGCDFEVVSKNIIELAKVRNAMKAKSKIQIQCIRTKYNDDHPVGLYHFFKKYMRKGDELFAGGSHSCASPWLAKQGYVVYTPTGKRVTPLCGHLENDMMVAADGLVPACCYDYNLEVTKGESPNEGLGDAKKASLLDIWNGETRKEYKKRTSSLDGKALPTHCRSCITLFGDFSGKIPSFPKDIPARLLEGGAMLQF